MPRPRSAGASSRIRCATPSCKAGAGGRVSSCRGTSRTRGCCSSRSNWRSCSTSCGTSWGTAPTGSRSPPRISWTRDEARRLAGARGRADPAAARPLAPGPALRAGDPSRRRRRGGAHLPSRRRARHRAARLRRPGPGGAPARRRLRGAAQQPPRSLRVPGRGALPRGRHLHGARSVQLPAHAGRVGQPPRRRRPPRAPLGAARSPPGAPPGHVRHLVRGLGAHRAVRVGGGRLQLVGRPPAPDARHGLAGHLGAVRPRGGPRDALQVRGPARQRRSAPPQGGPARVSHRGSAANRVGGARAGSVPVEGRRLHQVTRRRRPAQAAHLHLRSAHRLVAARGGGGRSVADLGRGGRAARRLRRGDGLHARRAFARCGAPLRRILGLPGHRLLRAHSAPRTPGRLPRPGGRSARARDRRDPRLGAGAFPHRPVRAGPVRRDGAVRARGPPAGSASRLGHARLQLRPQRGAQLPPRQRALLAGGVPRRRAAGGRGRLDAVPRLQPQARRVDPEQVRRARERGGHRAAQGSERARALPAPRRADDRGGIHRLPQGDRARGGRRAGLPPQVEPGMDARHAGLLRDRSGVSEVAPRRAHVRPHVHLHGELPPAPLARRGSAREGFLALAHGRRRLAEVRQPARAVRLDVGASGQEAALHGRRARAAGGVEPRPQSRLAPAAGARAQRRPAAGPRPEPGLPRGARAVRAGRRPRRFPMGAGRVGGRERAVLPAALGRAARGRRRQPFARAAPRLPRRPAARRRVPGGAQHRRGGVRRVGRGEPRPRARRAGAARRGAPLSAGGLAFLRFAASLGFHAVQLGPQGETTEHDQSPYDATIFSRSTLSLALAPLEQAGLLSGATLREAVARRPAGSGERAAHRHAHAVAREVVDEAFVSFEAERPRELADRLREFTVRQREWLDRDALYAAAAAEHREHDWLRWPEEDRRLWERIPGAEAAQQARRSELAAKHARLIERYRFGQWLAHEQHGAFQREAHGRGLLLYGDLQIGVSHQDVWSWGSLFLSGWRMGAPPSRTNPEGQPWSYAVLDPSQYAGAALGFVRRRAGKALEEFDGLRIDHPHGLIDPWVYRAAQPAGSGDTIRNVSYGVPGSVPDRRRAVQDGARLFSSPDLPDLASFALVRPEQLDRAAPRYADGWVRDLSEEQVARYARLFDAVVDAARARGRAIDDLLCEVLSTQPYPVERVLARHGLGRFRVTQKVVPGDPADVYRSENAAPADWIMAGTHDTEPIWRVAERWAESGSAPAHAAYLAERLVPGQRDRPRW